MTPQEVIEFMKELSALEDKHYCWVTDTRDDGAVVTYQGVDYYLFQLRDDIK